MSAVIEPDSRRNKTRIAFENPDYALKPGATGTINVTIAPHASQVGQVVRGTIYIDTFNGTCRPVMRWWRSRTSTRS